MDVLYRIPCDGLEAVFDRWLLRLDACIQRTGDYAEGGEFTKHFLTLLSRTHLALPKFSAIHCMNAHHPVAADNEPEIQHQQ
jgi:hypothetical protein